MSEKRPNLLFVTADQFRGDCLHCDGNEIISTPNYDALASQGVRFTRAYTPDPICVPARATMISGNYPHKCTGVKANGGTLKEDQIKLPQLLADNGYRTYASGKLHYQPYTPPGEPDTLYGFQMAALAESGRMLKHFDPEDKLGGVEAYSDYLKTVGWGGYTRAHGIGNNDVHPAASPLPEEHHVDAWVASQALEYLDYHRENHSEQPFYLNVGFPKPHSPYDPPRPWDAIYDPREMPEPYISRDGSERNPFITSSAIQHGVNYMSPEAVKNARAHYYGLISFQDKQFGRLVEYLKEHGLYENTIIVFVADHGDLMGDFGGFFKNVMQEASTRVPFIISYPEGIKGGRVTDEFAGLQDVVPTVASLIGVELDREVDGVDLAPLLKDEEFIGRDYIISYSLSSPWQTYMVRKDNWKYIYSEGNGTEELYDIEKDSGEEWNLAAAPEHRETLQELKQIMIDWSVENGDTELLVDGQPAVTPVDLSECGFIAKTMGWRWY